MPLLMTHFGNITIKTALLERQKYGGYSLTARIKGAIKKLVSKRINNGESF